MKQKELDDLIDGVVDEEIQSLLKDMSESKEHLAVFDLWPLEGGIVIYPTSKNYSMDFFNGKCQDTLHLKINFFDMTSKLVNELVEENLADKQSELVEKLKLFFQKQIEKLETFEE